MKTAPGPLATVAAGWHNPRMLHLRLVSGVGLIVFGLSGFWLDNKLDSLRLNEFGQRLFNGRTSPTPGLILLAICLLILPIASFELRNVFRAHGVRTAGLLISIATMLTSITMYITPIQLQAPTGIVIIATVLITCFISTLIWHSRHATVQGAVASAGATMFAVTYLGLLVGFYLMMRREHSAWVVLGIVLITKACDTGAYFTGRAFGRHKLIPWLSPGKTWEGLFGGVVFSVLAAYGLAALAHNFELTAIHHTVDAQLVRTVLHYDPLWVAAMGAVLAVVGHIGDLTMSLFKRDAGLKDSGTLFPGMGGILDLLDSPLLVGPVAYWMLQLAVRG